MQIRLFDARDTAGVASLWREALPDDRPHNQPLTVINNKVAARDDLFFVAEENAIVVGTIMAGYDGHRGWLYSVAVDPASRGKGFGRQLVNHAVRSLQELGCTKVNLQVRGDNSEVIAFYKSLGFSIEDRVSMGKLL
jgi:ribosomal protein S18 acetylase RimI-like enzyme